MKDLDTKQNFSAKKANLFFNEITPIIIDTLARVAPGL